MEMIGFILHDPAFWSGLHQVVVDAAALVALVLHYRK